MIVVCGLKTGQVVAGFWSFSLDMRVQLRRTVTARSGNLMVRMMATVASELQEGDVTVGR